MMRASLLFVPFSPLTRLIRAADDFESDVVNWGWDKGGVWSTDTTAPNHNAPYANVWLAYFRARRRGEAVPHFGESDYSSSFSSSVEENSDTEVPSATKSQLR